MQHTPLLGLPRTVCSIRATWTDFRDATVEEKDRKLFCYILKDLYI